jgi:maltooligosyltrehalose synthase
MLATATHDHKRGEDLRARLAVLSEIPQDWAEVLPRWIDACRGLGRRAGGPPLTGGDIAILLQTIVGAWPPDLDADDLERRAAFAERIAQWMEKALREAKLASDWASPNKDYEEAARMLVMSLLAENENPALVSDIVAFANRIGPAGAVNGLAQTLL